MKRGRPANSQVRQNITELIAELGEMHGYEVCKHYMKIFPKVSMRAIYYSLSKGVKKAYFRIAKVEKQAGSYSWGPEAQRTYYGFGELAKPKGDVKVKKYAEGIKKGKMEREPKISLLNP